MTVHEEDGAGRGHPSNKSNHAPGDHRSPELENPAKRAASCCNSPQHPRLHSSQGVPAAVRFYCGKPRGEDPRAIYCGASAL